MIQVPLWVVYSNWFALGMLAGAGLVVVVIAAFAKKGK